MTARREYRDRLVALEDSLLRAGDGYRDELGRAVGLVLAGEPAGIEDIITTDDALDGLAAYVRDEAIELVALQSPVAGDLRLLSAILHVDVNVERIGELAVNLARSASVHDPAPSDPLMAQFGELGSQVHRLVGRALENFARKRADLDDLVALDDEIDRLRHVLHARVVDVAKTDPDRVDWAIRMALAVTWLERAGDLAVGIARQVRYIVTGEPLARHG